MAELEGRIFYNRVVMANRDSSRVNDINHANWVPLTKISLDHPIMVKTCDIGMESSLEDAIDVDLVKGLLHDHIWVEGMK